jgi:hypothetical protein
LRFAPSKRTPSGFTATDHKPRRLPEAGKPGNCPLTSIPAQPCRVPGRHAKLHGTGRPWSS